MKFVTAKGKSGEFIGVMNKEEKRVFSIDVLSNKKHGKNNFPAKLIDCIAMGEPFISQVQKLVDWAYENSFENSLSEPLEDITLLAPIPRPYKNIICIGKNYADHAIEMGSAADIPKHIMVFTKAPTTVIGPHAAVLNHQRVTKELDYEGELAIIIGKKGKDIKKESAFDYIFGYTIINDVTARDLQTRHKQFFIGKSLDSTCPMGPWIAHHSIIEDPHKLQIETKINGEIRQSGNTDQFIFPIDEIVSVLSQGMTLEPGDIIATGTPAGVGKGFQPPKFLNPGDKMEITIDQIGTLTNWISKE